ncbi:MAG: hypothetical protein WCO96_04910 [Actinomycetes bacterium]
MSKLATLIAGPSIAIALAGCGSNVEKFTLVQTSAVRDAVDIGRNGVSTADTVYFHGPLTRDGKEVGHINGMTEKLALSPELAWTKKHLPKGSANPASEHLVLSTATFHLGGDDTILSEGQIFYDTREGVTIKVGQPQIRPITGGTGKYKFARGQMTIVNQGGGKYEFQIEVDTGP